MSRIRAAAQESQVKQAGVVRLWDKSGKEYWWVEGKCVSRVSRCLIFEVAIGCTSFQDVMTWGSAR